MAQNLNYAPIPNMPKDKSLMLSLASNLTLELFFHIIQSEQITLSTDITDHIVEDHTTVQDHITIKPRTFTMRGLISEKTYIAPDVLYIKQPEELWTNKLKKLAVLSPTMSSNISSAVNAVEAIANKINAIGLKIYNGITGAINTIKQLQGSPFATTIRVNQAHAKWSRDKIQKAIIDILDYYRVNRIPLSVNTGWGLELKDNYYITDIQVNQGDTYQQSELSVTVKELRFTDIKIVDLTKEKYDRYKIDNQNFTDTVTGQTEKPLTSKAWEAAHG